MEGGGPTSSGRCPGNSKHVAEPQHLGPSRNGSKTTRTSRQLERAASHLFSSGTPSFPATRQHLTINLGSIHLITQLPFPTCSVHLLSARFLPVMEDMEQLWLLNSNEFATRAQAVLPPFQVFHC